VKLSVTEFPGIASNGDATAQDVQKAEKIPSMTLASIDAMLDYNAPDPSRITKFLWWCAGADEQLLRFCATAEHIRYQGVGAFVFFTGALAFISGGYAIFTVFRPLDPNASLIGPAIGNLLFGTFWALTIFNLDRYIVSSTCKGDGKETISRFELVSAAIGDGSADRRRHERPNRASIVRARDQRRAQAQGDRDDGRL